MTIPILEIVATFTGDYLGNQKLASQIKQLIHIWIFLHLWLKHCCKISFFRFSADPQAAKEVIAFLKASCFKLRDFKIFYLIGSSGRKATNFRRNWPTGTFSSKSTCLSYWLLIIVSISKQLTLIFLPQDRLLLFTINHPTRLLILLEIRYALARH